MASSEQRERLRPGVFLRTGHRGARGLAPENTVLGFRRAVEIGVDILELDVQLTKDGEVVVFHDPTLDRTTEATGPIASRTWAELSALDAGHRFTPDGGATFPYRGQGARVPRLAEVLEAFPGHLFTIELKRSPLPGLIARTVAIVRERAPDRTILASAQHDLLVAARREAPELVTSCSGREVGQLFLLSRVRLAGLLFRSPAQVIQMPLWSDHDNDRGLTLLGPCIVKAAHARGMPVQVWTINDPVVMRAVIAAGVDGITTDRPDILAEVLARPGAPA